MFNFRPELPGFRVEPSAKEVVPGLHAWRPNEEVLSYRVNWPGNDVPTPRVNPKEDDPGVRLANSSPYPGGGSASLDASIWDKIRDPDWVAPRTMAAMDGAISIIPGALNAARAVGRAGGLLGKEEAKRFDREMEFVGRALGLAADHPDVTARAAVEMASELFEDPLLPYHIGGRGLAGYLLRAGPIPLGAIATAGDTLRAIEKGYSFADAIRRGATGTSWLRGLGR